MKILTVGSDKKIFEVGSEVRARIIEYGSLFDELHIIIFSQEKSNNNVQKIGSNVFAYPTNSLSRWFYIQDAIRAGKKVLSNKRGVKDWVLSAQDPFESGFVIYRLAKKFNLKFQLQIHTDFLSPFFSNSFLNRIRLLIANWIIPHADGFRVVSEKIKQSLLKHYKVDALKIIVLPIFIDVAKIIESNVTVDLKKKYPQFDKVILMATRLSGEKNVSFAIDVFSEVVKKNPKAGLVIVGDGPEKKKLELRIKNYELEKKIILEGFQKKEIIFSYYKTVDVFLQCSLYEGYGLALVEAGLSGLRAVSSDVGIARELGASLEFLTICPVNDKNCFVSGVNKLFERDIFRGAIIEKKGIDFEKRLISDKSEYLAKYKEALGVCISENW